MQRATIQTRLVLMCLPVIAATALLSAQQPNRTPSSQTPPAAQTSQDGRTFRATANYFATSVIARGKDGKFIPDLTVDDFKVYEDGVLQRISNFSLSVGGRMLGNVATSAPTGPIIEGLVLPASKPASDSSGRAFIIFIDDLQIPALDTPNVKALLKTVRDTLIHDNDLVGFVSSGHSSIASDLSYDYGHKRFDEAINKLMGSGLSVKEIIEGGQNGDGPTGVRYNAHTAFMTAFDILQEFGKLGDRRKIFIYVSNGYDFDPFRDSRYRKIQEQYGYNPENQTDTGGGDQSNPSSQTKDPLEDDYYRNMNKFAQADLVNELAQLTREAKRNNVTFYTIDPRGLGAGNSIAIDLKVGYGELRDFISTSQSSLKVIAEETGGHCVCNQNDFKTALQRIDNETSDYYQIGYYSTNPDPLRIQRTVKIEVRRADVELRYNNGYTIKRPKGK